MLSDSFRPKIGTRLSHLVRLLRLRLRLLLRLLLPVLRLLLLLLPVLLQLLQRNPTKADSTN